MTINTDDCDVTLSLEESREWDRSLTDERCRLMRNYASQVRQQLKRNGPFDLTLSLVNAYGQFVASMVV